MIRLYRFYNYAAAAHGMPFGLCDLHRAAYDPPILRDKEAMLEVVADNPRGMKCVGCDGKLVGISKDIGENPERTASAPEQL